jgi:hypothetical protein
MPVIWIESEGLRAPCLIEPDESDIGWHTVPLSTLKNRLAASFAPPTPDQRGSKGSDLRQAYFSEKPASKSGACLFTAFANLVRFQWPKRAGAKIHFDPDAPKEAWLP